MKKFRYMAVAGALLTVTAAMAVPAKRITFTATQPDGTTVTLTRAGDEFNRYFLTEDNQVVVGNESKGYYFATVDEQSGRMVASKVEAADVRSRDAGQTAFVAALNREALGDAMKLNLSKSRIAPKASSRTIAPKSKASLPAQSGVGLFPGASFPRTGSPKGLVILVEYTDVKFNTSYNAADYFKRMVSEKGFSEYGGTGSALDYFTEMSMGKFTPDFDVYGPVTLPQNQAYYGANDEYYDQDMRAEYMVVDGCKLLDNVINFKDYDTDGDGYVDNVFVFYAGQGEASYGDENTVWPHQWELESGRISLTLDGVKISRYACSNEWESTRPDGVGTFVHEFSHVMGLPDLYHTESSSAYYTPCNWSVLDYGPYNNDGRTPPAYSIFERNAMGWIDPVVLDKTPQSVKLEHIETSNEGCLIPTGSNDEFFLLENRQQSGWDTYIPGHGMLIWHIDYNTSVWNNNSVNNTESHQYVDIEEANNNPNGSNAAALQGWAFPGTNGRYTSFTDDTKPNMVTWSNKRLETPITNITEKDGIILFDVCGGAGAIVPPVVNTPDPDNIGTNYFIASWNPVEGAVDYLLTVMESEGDSTPSTDSCGFGSNGSFKLPSGWTSSHTKTYTSSGSYGISSPSYRMEKGYSFTTPRYDNPITKISFWAKGQGQTTNTASLYVVDGTKETKLTDFSDWNTKSGATVNYDIEDSSVYQLKFVYNKELNGNLAIDDVVITTGSSVSALPDYDEVSTKGATSVRVSNLPAGKTLFKYSVKAVDADNNKSVASNAVLVDLTMSGVEDVMVDDNDTPVEYYNLQGIKVSDPVSGVYIRRQGSHVEKVKL